MGLAINKLGISRESSAIKFFNLLLDPPLKLFAGAKLHVQERL